MKMINEINFCFRDFRVDFIIFEKKRYLESWNSGLSRDTWTFNIIYTPTKEYVINWEKSAQWTWNFDHFCLTKIDSFFFKINEIQSNFMIISDTWALFGLKRFRFFFFWKFLFMSIGLQNDFVFFFVWNLLKRASSYC